MFSSWSFIVLHFIFRPVIHFELIFVKSIRSVSGFYFFLSFECPLVPAPFVEKSISAQLYHLCSFVKGQLTIIM